MTVNELATWLANARPGDSIEYHRGFLAPDTDKTTSRLPSRRREELVRVSKTALTMSDNGHAHLIQRKHGDCDYSYIAVAA